MSVKISAVEPHSPAARHGISPGDLLISINSNEICDVLDYRFYINDKKLILGIRTAGGRDRRVVIHKKEQADIGLDFETYLMDSQQCCKNKCIFCFVDQMPQGMRDSLYFKDDDSRLSFLFGNYITLTGLSQREAQRIIDMHISPVNISVHTMNPDLRIRMMKNPSAGTSLSYLDRFCEAGIKMNTQLVLCPGINDGEELVESLNKLSHLYPAVQSIAAVPVGLTRYREGLCKLSGYDRESASKTIDIVEHFADRFFEEHGTRLAYAADEFYIKAQRPLPGYDYYEDFPQLDNGVGLCTLLKSEFMSALEDEPQRDIKRSASIATGSAAYPLIKELCEKACEKFSGLNIHVYETVNTFFGDTVTVAGLITGKDILSQLKDKPLEGELLLPEVMLRHAENVFLDDMTPSQLEEALGVSIRMIPNDGAQLLDALINEREC